jgi:hypothetical protein
MPCIVLANDIAVKAAEFGYIPPWPGGTCLARIAWQQAAGEDRLTYPGKFVQIELLVKEAGLYKESEGGNVLMCASASCFSTGVQRSSR